MVESVRWQSFFLHNWTQKYSIGINLICQKVENSYYILTDFDIPECNFYSIPYKNLCFYDMGESIRSQSFFLDHWTRKYFIETNLISQKVVNTYYIQTDFDSFEGAFFTAYLTRPYVFMTWESQLGLNASSYTFQHKNIP